MAKESPKPKFNQSQGWPIWFLIAVVIIIIFFVMDQGRKTEDAVSLNQIFKQDEPVADVPDEPVIERERWDIPVTSEEVSPPVKTFIKEATVESTTPIAKEETPPPPSAVPAVPEKTEPTLSSTQKKSGTLTIQVASFKDAAKAKQSLSGLKKAGFTGYIMERDLKDKGLHYRVCVGEFSTKEEADVELAKLKKISDYKQSFVITK